MNVKKLVSSDSQTFQQELRKLMTSRLSPVQRRRLATLIGHLRQSPEDAERFGKRATELDSETVSHMLSRALEADPNQGSRRAAEPGLPPLTEEESTRYEAVRNSFCSRLRSEEVRHPAEAIAAAKAQRRGGVACGLETWDLHTWDSPTSAFQGDGTVGARSASSRATIGEPPARIGPYRILECVGEGGLGVVYLGERRPRGGRVALKTVRPGTDSEWVRRRFEAERRALARVEHDSVVKVLGAGERQSGEPYLVLEHVPGVALTKYRDREQHGLRERLELFRQVCDGVQHMHESGVIHRDLKPSNVLVSDHDGEPMAKIVDFGLARLRSEAQPNAAEGEKIVGTPAYMSPEQASGASRHVGRRSDIYSMGMMLYELLTGRHPFSSREVTRGGVGVLLRRIREADPPAPSDSFAAAGTDSEILAANRRMDAPDLHDELRRELDALVMKAIHRDPSQRYDSARSLGEEIDSYLSRRRGAPPRARARSWVLLIIVAVVVAAATVMHDPG